MEVAQLYIQYPSTADEPGSPLKGFHRTNLLDPGHSETVTFELSDVDLAIWSVLQAKWLVVDGKYDIKVGASSRDIRLSKEIDITGS